MSVINEKQTAQEIAVPTNITESTQSPFATLRIRTETGRKILLVKIDAQNLLSDLHNYINDFRETSEPYSFRTVYPP
jgi:hypothetical protein